MKTDRLCHTCETVKPVDAFQSPGARRCDDCRARVGTYRRQRAESRCRACGTVKPRSEFRPRSSVCVDCKTARATQPRVCGGCDQLLPPERFRSGHRHCDACYSAARELPRPCMHCLVVKPRTEFNFHPRPRGTKIRRRRSVCRVCEQTENAARQQAIESRRVTFEVDGRVVRRCSHCGETKDLESEFYMQHRERNGVSAYRYWCRACELQVNTDRKTRDRQDPAKLERLRESQARWMREWRRRNPDRAREVSRRYRERVIADPDRHALLLEKQRMQHRLRREQRDGVNVTAIVRQPGSDRYTVMATDDLRAEAERRGIAVRVATTGRFIDRREIEARLRNDDERHERLPSAPLVAMIDRIATAETIGYDADVVVDVIRDRAGIHSRVLSGWRTGERPDVPFEQADAVLIALDVLWWEVFDEDTVRKPLITATRYVWRTKKLKDGTTGRYPLRNGTRRYGDDGPDLEALAQIQRAFEGDPEAVAA